MKQFKMKICAELKMKMYAILKKKKLFIVQNSISIDMFFSKKT